MINPSLIYKGLFLLLSGLGIILNITSWDTPFWMTLSYYTLQSNILCFGIIAMAFYYELRKKTVSSRFLRIKGGFTVMIFLTFVVYHFILRPFILNENIDYQVMQLSDVLVHYLAPFMMLFDHLIFTKGNTFKKVDPLWWLFIPLGYWLYTLLYAALGGIFILGDTISRYPYFFLNFESYGIGMVFISSLIILSVFLLLGYGLYFIDRWIYQRKNRIQT